jgi:hypothetical protein
MARLTSKKRKNLKSSEFAEPGEKAYPINDKAHARNALARVSQFGSESEKTAVRKKVHAKYPSIGEGGHKKATSKKSTHKRTSKKI